MNHPLRISLILALLLGFIGTSPAVAQETCNSSGVPWVSTDKDDYAPFETVMISGSGFGCGATLAVLVTAPDGNTLSGDGAGSPGPDTLTSDENGEFALSYQLYGTLPDGALYSGQEGEYTIQVLDAAGSVLANAAFSDGAGYDHACILTAQGGVKCWGNNVVGQLGNGTTLPSSIPVDVSGLTSGVIQVSSSYRHSCALLEDGKVMCWGKNSFGQLGNNTIIDSHVPGYVIGLDNAVQIGTGFSHSCALLEDGGVKCWGWNFVYDLGNGTNIQSLTPTSVLTRLPPDYTEMALLSDVVQLAVGNVHNCVLMAAGGVKCWGQNHAGQSGSEPRIPLGWSVVPVATDVEGLSSGVIQVSTGHSHTCALMAAGGIKCWGHNYTGQLGNGTYANYNWAWIPQDVLYEVEPASGQLAPLTGMTQISTGFHHSCALTADCHPICWGSNARYERGDGTALLKGWATLATAVEGSLSQVSAGNMFTCGLTDGGGVKCWGEGREGQLGNGAYLISATPVDVFGLASGVAQLSDHNLSCISNQPPMVDAGGPYLGDEGSQIVLDGANASDADDDPLTYNWSVDSALCSFDDASLLNPHLICDDNGSFNVTLSVDDGTAPTVSDEATVIVHNVAPALGLISVDQSLVQVDTVVNTSAAFADPGKQDTHTAVWDWGDSISTGVISESGGNGTASDSHSYSLPGIYTLRLVATDKDGATSNTAIYEFVVVYDPEGGFVTGGGWIESPEGAYLANPYLTGKANFGFVSKYKKSASIPTGQTEFQFKAGELNFHSESYQWLVVNQVGTNAQYKGQGTINGELAPNGLPYKFMIWATDEYPVEDTFRIRIWYEDGVEVVVYDNGFNQPIAGGSIQIHVP